MARQTAPLDREQLQPAPPVDALPRPGGARRFALPAGLGVYGRSRLFTLVVAAVAGWRIGAGTLSVLNRWDAGWFLRVAQDGYPHHIPMAAGGPVETTIPFFPLYPLLLRLVSALTPLSDLLAGVVVSLAAGGVAAAVIYRIALRLTGDSARSSRAVALFAFCPGSFVLSMPYSEALMVALAALCLLALLDERWWAAGLCAALATATRSSALALVPACLWHAVSVIRRDWGDESGPSGLRRFKPLVAPLLAPLGTIAYFGFLWLQTGDPLAYLHAQKAWANDVSLAGPVVTLTGRFLQSPFTAVQPAIATLSLLFVVVTGAMLVRRRWPGVLSVYSLSIVAISLLARSDGVRPRDILTAFPLFLAAADVLDERWMRVVVPASAALMALSLTFHNLGAWGPP